MRARLAVAALLLAAALGPVSAQQPATSPAQPTFRSEINYVELPVRVLDGKGNVVRELTQADFQLLEDGKPQTIAAFSVVDIPELPPDNTSLAISLTSLDASASNEPAQVDGRVYLFVLDDLQLRAEYSGRVKTIVGKFIREQVGANDLAAIVLTSGARGVDFTRNRGLLFTALDRFIAGSGPDDPSGDQKYSALKTLADMSDWLGAIKGRHKALVYVSAADVGCRLTQGPTEGDDCNSVIWDTVRAAQRSDVSIYSLDPRGLEGPSYTKAEVSDRSGSARGLSRATFAEARDNGPFNALRALADETGGFAAMDTNNFKGALDRIVRENTSYYLIGYYSTNDKADGRFRKTEVKLNRKGVQVLYRPGYAAAKPSRPSVAPNVRTQNPVLAQLNALMRSPLPVSGMTLHVSAAPFLGTDGKASVVVVVETPGDALKFTEGNGLYATDIGLSIGLYGADGKARSLEQPNIKLNLRSDAHARALKEGIRLVARLDALPGSYRMWVGATQSPSNVRGSVMTEVVVPDFTKEPLAMSGLAMSSSVADRMMTARHRDNDASLDGQLGAPPAAQREFPADSEIWIFCEIYDNRSGGGEVTSSILVKSLEGRTMYQAPFEASSVQFGYLARIALKDFPSGSYIATVGARSATPGAVFASRSLQFSVR
jgi:VWFA-related protein